MNIQKRILNAVLITGLLLGSALASDQDSELRVMINNNSVNSPNPNQSLPQNNT